MISTSRLINLFGTNELLYTKTAFYDLAGTKAGAISLTSIEMKEISDVNDGSLLVGWVQNVSASEGKMPTAYSLRARK